MPQRPWQDHSEEGAASHDVQEGRIGEQGTERNKEQERGETLNLYMVWVPLFPSHAPTK